jgi:hypothetical protein
MACLSSDPCMIPLSLSDICMDLNVQNEEVGDEQSFPPVSMPPMRPPRDISASVTPRPMAPNRDASVSVRSWMSPRIVQPEIGESESEPRRD